MSCGKDTRLKNKDKWLAGYKPYPSAIGSSVRTSLQVPRACAAGVGAARM